MTQKPHPDAAGIIVNCAVITVSDTRSPDTDQSGQLIQQRWRDLVIQSQLTPLFKMNPHKFKLK